MKNLIIALLSLLSYTTMAQEIDAESWKKEAQTNIRLAPKYGNAIKSEAEKVADAELIKSYTEREGTARKASELLVQLGFSYLNKGDLKTAMYRFNQAWLLDPKNENVQWGFGGVYFRLGDFESAIEQYDEGLKINPKSSDILTDKATIYVSKYDKSESAADLKMATSLFKQSYKFDPKNQNTLFKMSVLYYITDDCVNAKRYFLECKKLGGKQITPGYEEALYKKCK